MTTLGETYRKNYETQRDILSKMLQRQHEKNLDELENLINYARGMITALILDGKTDINVTTYVHPRLNDIYNYTYWLRTYHRSRDNLKDVDKQAYEMIDGLIKFFRDEGIEIQIKNSIDSASQLIKIEFTAKLSEA